MSPFVVSYFLMAMIGVVSIWNCIHMSMRRLHSSRLESFKEEFTTELSLQLLEPDIDPKKLADSLKIFPMATTEVGAQVIIDYHNCITGHEREIVAKLFVELGHLQKTIEGAIKGNEETRIRCLSWLLYIRMEGIQNILLRSTTDQNRLIRLIGISGISMISDLPVILKAIKRLENDFGGKHDAAMYVMQNVGKRFGPEHLLEISRSLTLSDNLRRAAVMVLAEMKPIEYLEEIDYILQNFGLLTPQEILNVQFRLKDLYELMNEAA